MPRLPRPVGDGFIYHAINRGNNRHAVFTGEDDYRAHRSGGFGLDPPLLFVVPRGMFEAWMKSRGQLGGQHKVPRLSNDRKFIEEIKLLM